MADREILERIDRHMERGNELMVELRAEIKQNRRVFERVIEKNERVIEENTRVIGDLRVFMRDLVTRQDRRMDEVAKELRDLRDESRAQRKALLKLVDRLPPPGDAPAAA